MKYVDDKDLAYVMQRYREVHDFVHTLASLSIRFVSLVCMKDAKFLLAKWKECAMNKNNNFHGCKKN